MKRNLLVILVLMLLVLLGCAPGSAPTVTVTQTAVPTPVPAPLSTETTTPTPSPTLTLTPIPAPTTPTPTPPRDTTPPSAITGLVAVNAYDKRVNLGWDRSAATDFDHYNIYLNKAEMADVTGMKAIQQVKDSATCRYQATELEDETKYYFAVTAVDKSGNEGVKVTSVGATSTPMPRGTVDPDLAVDVYQSELAWAGTTLLADSHNPSKPRIIEVNMLGEIIRQYMLTQNLGKAGDVELLPNNNILFTANEGVYEIDRSGKVVWQYLTSKLDHDADRLPNGNTIFVFANKDQKSDAQVTEVNPKGEIVWQWYARDYFDRPPYNSIKDEGGSWIHTNAVSRLDNGNTLISLRNFNFVVEVDPKGAVVRTIGEGICYHPHDPEIQPNGNILVANHSEPNQAIELDPKTGKIVWKYTILDKNNSPVRDADRLPNGNTLITGTTKIIEVTSTGEIVWQFGLKGISFSGDDAQTLGFYKADRISAQK